MRDPEKLAILTGLLDFYSDRATAHASFVVAGIFGIYALITAKNMLPLEVFASAYIALVGVDLYSFLNFGYYALKADIVKDKLTSTPEYEKDIKKEIRRRSRNLFRWFDVLKGYGMKDKRKSLTLFMLWLISVVLPLFFVGTPSSNLALWIVTLCWITLIGLIGLIIYRVIKHIE